MSNDQATAVKRVAPYPITATLQLDGKPVKIALIFVSNKGFVARTPGLMLKVGAAHEVAFEIPVLHHQVKAEAKIFKTYDRAADSTGKTVERAAEFLFVALDRLDEKQILRFTKAIGQKSA